jgi:hypothetical protein
MRSKYSFFDEYSHTLAGFAHARYPLYLLSGRMVFRSLNEFIKFSMEIDIRPSCFVHPYHIHL